MTQSKASNFRTDITSRGGGAVTVAIASNVGRGNGGTALPCRKCYVQARQANSNPIQVNINAAATAALGITLPYHVTGAGVSNGWLELEIDDVSKLYFYGSTNGDDIDILYVL